MSGNDRATVLFVGTALVAAIVVAGMLVSGYHAGILDNRVEWVFWMGAIFGAAGVGVFSTAILARRPDGLIRVGLALFVLAPVLCVVAVMTDYWL